MSKHKPGHTGQGRNQNMRDADPDITVQVTQKLIDRVKAAAVDGHLDCETARAIATEYSVPVRAVGVAADLWDIRISKCDLGCF